MALELAVELVLALGLGAQLAPELADLKELELELALGAAELALRRLLSYRLELDYWKEKVMDQGEWIALGLALGFGLGWLTAWIQERAYWREKVQALESLLDLQTERSARLGLNLDLELQKIQELRSQLGTLLELELAQAQQEQEQPR